MRFQDAVYGWEPGTDRIAVGQGRYQRALDEGFLMTAGACDRVVREIHPEHLLARMLLNFHTITVRDGVSVAAAHREFLKIDEYRWFISRDTPGATDAPEDGEDLEWWDQVRRGLAEV